MFLLFRFHRFASSGIRPVSWPGQLFFFGTPCAPPSGAIPPEGSCQPYTVKPKHATLAPRYSFARGTGEVGHKVFVLLAPQCIAHPPGTPGECLAPCSQENRSCRAGPLPPSLNARTGCEVCLFLRVLRCLAISRDYCFVTLTPHSTCISVRPLTPQAVISPLFS